MKSVHDIDDGSYKLTNEVGRYLALWMSYEDSIRVADLKTRASRFARFRREVGATPEQIVNVSEFMHPRVEELCDVMPARLGKFVLGNTMLRRFLGFFCKKGRVVHTTKLTGFLLLFLTSRLRRFRRGTYRFKVEQARIEQWIRTVMSVAPTDYELAFEIAQCPRLIKGYGETHKRGLRSFNRILESLDNVRGNKNGAATVKRYRDAALMDEHGIALDQAMSDA
jgi:indolepyruvate ferredoxin oxidoreductase beta subunit